ncbi:unnamed protein product, partial [Allacma fusca]
DLVSKHILDGVRLTHQVGPIAFSDTLKTIALACANYHALAATPVTDPGLEAQCPQAKAAGAYELLDSYLISDPWQSPSNMYRSALWTWFEVESSKIDYSGIYDDKFEHACQMVWKSTTQFACGISTRTSPAPNPAFYISCIFNPPGNVAADFKANCLPDDI